MDNEGGIMTAYGKNQNDQATGIIIMWSDTLGTIPSGWIICDGNNGTPDLRDTFVKCVPNSGINPGDTGGEAEHNLTISEIPNHDHDTTEPAGGGHRHPDDVGINWTTKFPRIANQSGGTPLPFFKFVPSGDGNNMIDQFTDFSGISATVDDSGGNQPHENRPSFFEVIYIQKT